MESILKVVGVLPSEGVKLTASPLSQADKALPNRRKFKHNKLTKQ
jgi:hypothetical protein